MYCLKIEAFGSLLFQSECSEASSPWRDLSYKPQVSLASAEGTPVEGLLWVLLYHLLVPCHLPGLPTATCLPSIHRWIPSVTSGNAISPAGHNPGRKSA